MNKKLIQATLRLHLKSPFLASCEATIIAVDPNRGIVLDRTPAYAKGGGQEGDHGTFYLPFGIEIPFFDTLKGEGRRLTLEDFPNIPVNVPVYHKINPEDAQHFVVGKKLRIKIDIVRRASLTVSHTGLHLVLMGLEKLYPDIYPRIIGCQIKETSAKLDFAVEEKMSNEDFAFAEKYANELIARDLPMYTFPHEAEPEAYYWQLEETIFPCGGTHLKTTLNVGPVQVFKKNMGRGKQRVSFKFPNAEFPIDQYFDE